MYVYIIEERQTSTARDLHSTTRSWALFWDAVLLVVGSDKIEEAGLMCGERVSTWCLFMVTLG